MDKNIKLFCLYCADTLKHNSYLVCCTCHKYIHVKCLKRPGTPGDFCDDIFFKFTCINCSKSRETFERSKLPWFMIIILTIHNLSIKSKGLSNHGYFHWRSHIANFIDKNWLCLFGAKNKQKKNWIGTISGILSHHSPEYFHSGQNILNETGWWKLSKDKKPIYFFNIYQNNTKIKHKGIKRIKLDDEFQYENEIEIEENKICSRHLPYMGKKFKLEKDNSSLPTNNEILDNTNVQINLLDFLNETFDANISNHELDFEMNENNNGDILLMNNLELVNFEKDDINLFNYNSNFDEFESKESDAVLESNKHITTSSINVALSKSEIKSNNVEISEENIFLSPKIIQIVNFQDENAQHSVKEVIDQNKSEKYEEILNEFCEKSLFTKTQRRKLPWVNLENSNNNERNEQLKHLSEREEKLLLNNLQKVFKLKLNNNINIPDHISRFYRKLQLRESKRMNGKELFDLEKYGTTVGYKHMLLEKSANILDRFTQYVVASTKKKSFYSSLIGSFEPELFESPYTLKILYPYIFKSELCFPLWLKLLCEIQYHKNYVIPIKSTIDYCYVRPYHIASINSLLQQMFWPGIDMAETLTYPDFTIVALYKKLVIGCAFLVPDVTYNEAYISFMAVRPNWQRSGIATFMLYHLTQSCMNKDITLHVSASNPAICLYQKFGFKIEEVIIDFYDKYSPANSKESRNAFFLRLKRS